ARRATASSSKLAGATTRRPTRRRSSSTRKGSKTGCPRAHSPRRPSSACSRRRTLAELLAELARKLVDDPDAVRVDEIERDGAHVLQLHVAKDDVGKVIGRQGRIARALRTIVRASAARSDHRVLVEIVD